MIRRSLECNVPLPPWDCAKWGSALTFGAHGFGSRVSGMVMFWSKCLDLSRLQATIFRLDGQHLHTCAWLQCAIYAPWDAPFDLEDLASCTYQRCIRDCRSLAFVSEQYVYGLHGGSDFKVSVVIPRQHLRIRLLIFLQP